MDTPGLCIDFFASCPGTTQKEKNQVAKGVSQVEVINSYVYLLSRYLVIRQEMMASNEEGVDYNIIKYNETGKADFVNPNIDVELINITNEN
jgi:hypothetical protein